MNCVINTINHMIVFDLLLYIMYRGRFESVCEENDIFGAKIALSISFAMTFMFGLVKLLLWFGVSFSSIAGAKYWYWIILVLSAFFIFWFFGKRTNFINNAKPIMQKYKLDKRWICLILALLVVLGPGLLFAGYMHSLKLSNGL
ncbi:MAG: hypothetical protein IKQ72_13115 [Bacteroidaceae bacterium]|nr:hypothetical protein [Bacteroidaceae bacterium]